MSNFKIDKKPPWTKSRTHGTRFSFYKKISHASSSIYFPQLKSVLYLSSMKNNKEERRSGSTGRGIRQKDPQLGNTNTKKSVRKVS